MDQMQMAARPRSKETKRANGRLRAGGRIPAIVYGGENDPRMLSLDEHEIEMVLHGTVRTNAIFNLSSEDGSKEQTIIREVQRHPLSARIIHIDFQRIDVNKPIAMNVPVHIVGADPAGVREGGVLEHLVRTVTVRCKPLDIPRSLDADLSELKVNETYQVRELVLPENVELLDDPAMALFSILPPTTAQEEEEEAAAESEEAPTEPEVIGEKGEKGEKKEGEE